LRSPHKKSIKSFDQYINISLTLGEEPQFDGHNTYHNDQKYFDHTITFFNRPSAGKPSAKSVTNGKNKAVFPVYLIIIYKYSKCRNGINKGDNYFDCIAFNQGKTIDSGKDQKDQKTCSCLNKAPIDADKEE